MKNYIDEKSYWLSSDKFLGKSFSFKALDLELEDNLEFVFDSFLKSLDSDIRVKISLFESYSNQGYFNLERANDIKEKGFLTTSGFIHFEHVKRVLFKDVFNKEFLKKEENLIKKLSQIENSIDRTFLSKLNSKPKSSFIFKDIYNLHKPIGFSPCGLKTQEAHLGILKLKNTGNHPLNLKSLAFVLERIPKPLSFHISFEKMSALKAEKLLKGRSKQEAEGQGGVSFEKYKELQKAISEVEIEGEELFYFEVHIMLRRLWEDYLRKDLNFALKALSSIGEWSLESLGAYPSLQALSPGSDFHYKLIEKSSVLKCFLPFFRFGADILEDKNLEDNRNKEKKEPNNRSCISTGSLIFHRRDFSLDTFNPFSSKYSNHTGVIVGKSGKGKSVFTNLLTKSLFYDKRATIFLVDVKGSYKKMLNELGGKTYNIDIKNSSNLNPLKHLNQSKESIEIASSFLEQLLLEEGELFLPLEEKTELEKSIIQFSKKETRDKKGNKKEKTLDDFYKHLKHSRKKKLARFIKGSLNENLFKSIDDISNDRLNYFNFENISTASNSLIAKAIIAGIMAEFSFKLLKKKPNEKFIFISDETPFFIKNCFNTFSLLSKNVRKLNGSLILIAQNSKDLIFNGDSSLIDNSEFKILFSMDGEEKKFKERFGLTNSEFQKLKHIRTVKGEFSQFLLKDSIGCRCGFLRLSKKEYIQSNTEPDFLHKVKEIQKLLGVNEEKALKVMSHV